MRTTTLTATLSYRNFPYVRGHGGVARRGVDTIEYVMHHIQYDTSCGTRHVGQRSKIGQDPGFGPIYLAPSGR